MKPRSTAPLRYSSVVATTRLHDKIYDFLKLGFVCDLSERENEAQPFNSDSFPIEDSTKAIRLRMGQVLLMQLIPSGKRSNPMVESMKSLLNCIQKGTEHDLKQFIEHRLDVSSIPLGLKKRFLSMLEEERISRQSKLFKQHRHELFHQENAKDIELVQLQLHLQLQRKQQRQFDGTIALPRSPLDLHRFESATRRLCSLWQSWKSGSISVEALFSKVNSAAALGMIAMEEAREITRLALIESGYLPVVAGDGSVDSPASVCWEVPMFMESALCFLPELSNLFASSCLCGIDTLTLSASNGSYTSLYADQGCTCQQKGNSVIHFSSARCMTSSPDLMWEQRSGHNRLLLEDASRTSLQQSRRGPFKSVLVIGDTISMRECEIEVYEVVMVDAFPSSVDARATYPSVDSLALQQEFVILLEGSLAPGAGTACFSSGSSNGTKTRRFAGCDDWTADGETDVGSPDPHRPSSPDSSDDQKHLNVPPFELQRNFFVVFAQCLDGIVSVSSVLALHDLLYLDQVPVSIACILLPPKDLAASASSSSSSAVVPAVLAAVVRGSSGLLCIVQPLQSIVKSDTAIAIEVHSEEDSNSGVVYRLGLRGSFAFYSLTTDTLLPPNSSTVADNREVSHEAGAVITAVDYNVNCGCIASGDDTGTLCLWHLSASGTFLRAAPLRIAPRESKSAIQERINSLCLADSGQHIAVALRDHLLLVGLADVQRSDNMGLSREAERPSLFVRSCLDVIDNVSARYKVSFGATLIRVWRITEQPVGAVQMAATSSRSSTQDLRTVMYDSIGLLESPIPQDVSGTELVDMDISSDSYDSQESFLEKDIEEAGPIDTSLPGSTPSPVLLISTWLHSNIDDLNLRSGCVTFDEWITTRLDVAKSFNATSRSVEDALVGDHRHHRSEKMEVSALDVELHCDNSKDAEDASFVTTCDAPTRVQQYWKVDNEYIPEFSAPRLGVSQMLAESSGQPDEDSCSDQDDEGTIDEYHRSNDEDTALYNDKTNEGSSNDADATAITTVVGIAAVDLSADEQEYEDEGFHNIRRSLTLHPDGSSAQYGHAQRYLFPESVDSRGNASSAQDSHRYVLPAGSLESPTLPASPMFDVYDHSAPLVRTASNVGGVVVNHRDRNYQHYASYSMVRTSDIDGENHGAPVMQQPQQPADEQGSSLYAATNVAVDQLNARARQPSLRVDALSGALISKESTASSRFRSERASSAAMTRRMSRLFVSDSSIAFNSARLILAIVSVTLQPPALVVISAALECSTQEILNALHCHPLCAMLEVVDPDRQNAVVFRDEFQNYSRWFCSLSYTRIGEEFWIDPALGHNALCSLYLRFCGNKSVAIEHPWQDYLRCYGAMHLRHTSRGLRLLTAHVRKIDETANIRGSLPRQIGYITGLYEIYARRVGLRGRIPKELGELEHLRVLSMGNNHLSGQLPRALGQLKNLQRIVLHQNNLRGEVPAALGQLGCIVNLAGNALLEHGAEVPKVERLALIELFSATKGGCWNSKKHWCSDQPVAKWYKVGVLSSHVHSLVMSSNGMDGSLPASINRLKHLRMIELATMPGLVGPIPKEMCSITTLRRLCICRCGLSGRLPAEIGNLIGLEELQLFGNNLIGKVPDTLGNLTNLRLLSLGEYTGGNNFSPDALPLALSKLTKLEALFMANCHLRGELPEWIGNLTELRQLDLQRNQLRGPLPRSIGQLQNLLYLNIKDNEAMSGLLPTAELLTLTKLNRLSLVHCGFDNSQEVVDAMRDQLPRCKVWI